MNYYQIVKELISYTIEAIVVFLIVTYLPSRPLSSRDRVALSLVCVLVTALFEKVTTGTVLDKFSDCGCNSGGNGNGNGNGVGNLSPMYERNGNLGGNSPMYGRNGNGNGYGNFGGSGNGNGNFGGNGNGYGNFGGNGNGSGNGNGYGNLSGNGNGNGNFSRRNGKLNKRKNNGLISNMGDGPLFRGKDEYAGQDPDGYDKTLLCKDLNDKGGSLELPIKPVTINGEECDSVKCIDGVCSVSCDGREGGFLTQKECREYCYKGMFRGE